MNVTIKPAESRGELTMALELMVAAHIEGDLAARRWLEDCSYRYPAFRPEHTRVATRKGEVLGALHLFTDTVRIGEARLKMGGLAWVAVSQRHRKRGIGRTLIDETLAYMREHGYHVSMLFGIPNFYHRFGYVSALADYTVLMDTAEARTFDNPFKAHFAAPSEIPLLQKMHAANDVNAACSIVRTAAHLHNKWGRWNRWRILKDGHGKAVAYLYTLVEHGCLYVTEVGLSEPGVCAAVVREAARIAHADDVAHIRFCVPPPHPLARFLAQFSSVHETRIERGGGGMMAFVNLGESLESMVPEWDSLLARSVARELRTEFTLVVDKANYRVRANRGVVDVAATAGACKIGLASGDLMHLLTGYRHPGDVLEERRCILTTDARTLFHTLFPKRHPYVWRFDRF